MTSNKELPIIWKTLSLTEYQNKKMRQLSGGMKRRVGLIARGTS